MPLGLTLSSDIQSATESPGDTAAACAQTWANLMGTYFTGVVPASIGVPGAQTALQASLTSAFSAAPGAGLALIETAFLTFATAVGAGMAPAFVAVPPPALVGFANLSPAETAAEAASNLASIISTWAQSGSATPSAGGPPVLWT